MFENQFIHEVVGLGTKFFRLCAILSDKEPRYLIRFLCRQVLDTFSIGKMAKH